MTEFFSSTSTPEIQISGSPEAFSFISDYQSIRGGKYVDVYIPVDIDITYQGKQYSFPEAGIRMKGNTSRSPFFTGSYFTACVHFKISFKATFDDDMYDDAPLQQFKHDWSDDAAGRKARKKRNFLGLEKLDVKYVSRNYGMTIAREIYAYDSFARQGIYAPMSRLGNVTLRCGDESISNQYEFIETIDKEFMKRRVSKEEAAGDLYKCVYNNMGKADFTRQDAVDKSNGEHIPYGKIGVEDNYNSYVPVYQLKTNDDLMQGSDFSNMTNLLYGLWNCVYGGGTKEYLENLIDVDWFLRFSAVSFLLGNFDDQRYNYNNFYVYFRPSDGKAIFLPYDWDWCLGNDMGHDIVSKEPLDSWTLDGGNNSNVYQATLVGYEPSYSRESYRNRYLAYIQNMKGDVLSASAYRAFAARYDLQYSDETEEVVAYMNEKLNHCG